MIFRRVCTTSVTEVVPPCGDSLPLVPLFGGLKMLVSLLLFVSLFSYVAFFLSCIKGICNIKTGCVKFSFNFCETASRERQV